jgi:hypothetical protein
VASIIWYWAVKLTVAAASAHSPAAALRSHRPERSWPGPAGPGRVLAASPAVRTPARDSGAGAMSASVKQGVMGAAPGLWPGGWRIPDA